LQDLQKYTQSGILGLKINHLATLRVNRGPTKESKQQNDVVASKYKPENTNVKTLF
jgi:hypothetical protein